MILFARFIPIMKILLLQGKYETQTLNLSVNLKKFIGLHIRETLSSLHEVICPLLKINMRSSLWLQYGVMMAHRDKMNINGSSRMGHFQIQIFVWLQLLEYNEKSITQAAVIKQLFREIRSSWRNCKPLLLLFAKESTNLTKDYVNWINT